MAAALRQQYGLRVAGKEFESMRWEEFADLIRGLSEGTALAGVARVRTETDREAIRQMTPAQRRERMEWQRRRAAQRTESETMGFVAQMQRAFAQAFGGE